MKRSYSVFFTIGALLIPIAFWPAATFAHVGHGTMGSGDWLAGFLHPITGVDHMAAMVAVGIWAAWLGRPAIWALPIAFLLVMAAGSLFGVTGVPLPGNTIGVALSGVALGSALAFAWQPALPLATAVISVFALYHGHTHGVAVPPNGVPLAFGAGFVLATGVLHLAGIAIGQLVRWPLGARLTRVGGVVVAVTGLFFLATYSGVVSA